MKRNLTQFLWKNTMFHPNFPLKILLLLVLILSACQPSTVQTNPSPTPDAATPTVPVEPAPPPSEPTPGEQSQFHSSFNAVASELEQGTQVPLRLPQFIPGAEDPQPPIYANVENLSPSEYSIIVGFTPNCTGGTACRLGTVTGQTLNPSLPPLTGSPVSLANGITGYFTDFTCGANCSDATVSWEQEGARYSVGIKAGKQETLVKMANSAIANGS